MWVQKEHAHFRDWSLNEVRESAKLERGQFTLANILYQFTTREVYFSLQAIYEQFKRVSICLSYAVGTLLLRITPHSVGIWPVNYRI